MKSLAVKFVKKYTITFITIVLFAIALVYNIRSLGDIYTNNLHNNLIVEITMLIGGLIESTFFLTKIFDVYKSKLPTKVKNNEKVSAFLVLFIALIVHIIARVISILYIDFGNGYLIYYNSIIFSSLICFLIVHENNMNVPEYIQKVFINILILMVVYLIILAGTGILFYITVALFKHSNYEILLDIVIFESVIIINVGKFVAIEGAERVVWSFEKVLIKYIMFVMVVIGFIFFYIYLVKMIIVRELPSNEVFGVCTVLFCIGLFIALMGRSFDDNKIYDKVIKYIPITFIPAFILQSLSLFLRINQYGLTTTRYFGCIVLIFELSYLIIYIFNNKKLIYVFIVISVLAFLMSYVPFLNAYQFPNIYNSFF